MCCIFCTNVYGSQNSAAMCNSSNGLPISSPVHNLAGTFSGLNVSVTVCGDRRRQGRGHVRGEEGVLLMVAWAECGQLEVGVHKCAHV